jgi:hypothetical protein
MIARFTAGMKVITYRHRQEPATRTVVRVTKTTVVLDNGDVYNQSGSLRGGDSIYGEHIKPFTDEAWNDIAAMREEKLRRVRAQARKTAVLRFVYDLTDDEVEELYHQLRNKNMPEVKP